MLGFVTKIKLRQGRIRLYEFFRSGYLKKWKLDSSVVSRNRRLGRSINDAAMLQYTKYNYYLPKSKKAYISPLKMLFNLALLDRDTVTHKLSSSGLVGFQDVFSTLEQSYYGEYGGNFHTLRATSLPIFLSNFSSVGLFSRFFISTYCKQSLGVTALTRGGAPSRDWRKLSSYDRRTFEGVSAQKHFYGGVSLGYIDFAAAKNQQEGFHWFNAILSQQQNIRNTHILNWPGRPFARGIVGVADSRLRFDQRKAYFSGTNLETYVEFYFGSTAYHLFTFALSSASAPKQFATPNMLGLTQSGVLSGVDLPFLRRPAWNSQLQRESWSRDLKTYLLGENFSPSLGITYTMYRESYNRSYDVVHDLDEFFTKHRKMMSWVWLLMVGHRFYAQCQIPPLDPNIPVNAQPYVSVRIGFQLWAFAPMLWFWHFIEAMRLGTINLRYWQRYIRPRVWAACLYPFRTTAQGVELYRAALLRGPDPYGYPEVPHPGGLPIRADQYPFYHDIETRIAPFRRREYVGGWFGIYPYKKQKPGHVLVSLLMEDLEEPETQPYIPVHDHLVTEPPELDVARSFVAGDAFVRNIGEFYGAYSKTQTVFLFTQLGRFDFFLGKALRIKFSLNWRLISLRFRALAVRSLVSQILGSPSGLSPTPLNNISEIALRNRLLFNLREYFCRSVGLTYFQASQHLTWNATYHQIEMRESFENYITWFFVDALREMRHRTANLVISVALSYDDLFYRRVYDRFAHGLLGRFKSKFYGKRNHNGLFATALASYHILHTFGVATWFHDVPLSVLKINAIRLNFFLAIPSPFNRDALVRPVYLSWALAFGLLANVFNFLPKATFSKLETVYPGLRSYLLSRFIKSRPAPPREFINDAEFPVLITKFGKNKARLTRLERSLTSFERRLEGLVIQNISPQNLIQYLVSSNEFENTLHGRGFEDFRATRFLGGDLREYNRLLLRRLEASPQMPSAGVFFWPTIRAGATARMPSLNFGELSFNLENFNLRPNMPAATLQLHAGVNDVISLAKAGGTGLHSQFFLFFEPARLAVTRSYFSKLVSAQMLRFVDGSQNENTGFDNISTKLLHSFTEKNVEFPEASNVPGLANARFSIYFFDHYERLGFMNLFESHIYGEAAIDFDEDVLSNYFLRIPLSRAKNIRISHLPTRQRIKFALAEQKVLTRWINSALLYLGD